MTSTPPLTFSLLQRWQPEDARAEEERPPLSNTTAKIVMIAVANAAFVWSIAGCVLR